MHTPKSLLLALAAAGFAGSASAPSAEFSSVFVPELAATDGMLCRKPGFTGSAAFLRLAQAAQASPQKRTEISPAAPAAAQAVRGSGRAGDAPLLPGLGTRTLEITTPSNAARQYFDQGYRLAWGFNHDEALRAFRKAQALDPQCAMCFWGEAWALGPNINVPMDAKANAPAFVQSIARSVSRHAYHPPSRLSSKRSARAIRRVREATARSSTAITPRPCGMSTAASVRMSRSRRSMPTRS
jgi:hypothetical protein